MPLYYCAAVRNQVELSHKSTKKRTLEAGLELVIDCTQKQSANLFFQTFLDLDESFL